MNEEKLIWGAGFIDDDLVSEAIDYKPHRIRLAPWACAAAAAVVLVTAVAVIARQIGKTPVLPPDSSGIGTSTGMLTDPENSNDPPDYSKPPNNSTGTSMSTVTTVDIDPEPQPVDIGNGMTLVGTPIDEDDLAAFSMTFDYSNGFLKDEAKEFIDELGVPGLSELTGRMLRLTRYCLSPIDMPWADDMYSPDGSMPPYIQTANGRYFETGYAYESCRTEYTLTFTKENVEEIFQKYDVFLNYNGELFCSDGSRGGQVGVVRREYELISKSDTVIEFRELIFYKDNDDKPAAEYVPELRDEYDLGVIDFKFVLTEDGWRAANIPVEYETSPSYLSPNEDFSVNRVYADDEVVPRNWLPVMSRAECMANIEEVMDIDTSGNFTEGVLSDLMNKNILCFELFYGVSRDLFYIEWDYPYDHPDFKNPIYPIFPKQPGFLRGMQSDLIIHTIYNLAFDTYESSVAEELVYGVSDLNDEPRYLVKDGQLYINNHAFPNWSSNPFVARSYVEVIERSDNKRTFIWHYPDVEGLNPPKSGYEFFYFDKTYTAEYIDGAWKLTNIINNL